MANCRSDSAAGHAALRVLATKPEGPEALVTRARDCLRNVALELHGVQQVVTDPALDEAAMHLERALDLMYAAGANQAGPSLARRSRPVVVLDANRCNGTFLERALTASGYPVITTEHAREAVQALRLDEPLALIANVATLPGYERTQLGSALAGTGTRAVVIGSPDWAEEHGATALPDSYTPRQLIDALRPSGSPTVPRPTIEVPTDPVPAILAGHVPLPGLAPATAAIHRLLDNTEQGAVEITRVVMADPSVAGALLRQANSGRFEVSREIASVQEACVRLGNRMVVSLANEVLLAAALRVEGTAVRSIATRMLANFRATADLAEKMARSKGHPDPSEVRTAALLHNIGDVLLLHRAAAFAPVWESRGVSVEQRMAEQSRAEHAEVGAELLESWGLPGSLVQIARYQDTAEAPVRGDDALTLDVVRMAYQAALRAGRDYLPGQLTAAQ